MKERQQRTPMFKVTTIAGTGVSGDQNGEGADAQFDMPCGVAVDGDDNVIVTDLNNHRICKITPQGHVSTLAGTGILGHLDGEGTVARFYFLRDVAVDGGGNIIVVDTHCYRKITPQGHVSTLAGTGVRASRR
jgi:hypothetical protein